MDELLPTKQYPPAEYDVAKRRTVPHDSTREDVAEFIMEYLYSDVSSLSLASYLLLGLHLVTRILA